jgi:diaminohydroxyphosphoribosylaminopyrimidine deaminase/5-amino-6-(5-phosphoribosylamino)uracil reductase
MLDPTSRGEGGVARLRAAGVTVEVGVLEDEALLVLGPWSESLRTGRPIVTWLYALSAEGEPIPIDAGASESAVADARAFALAVDIVIHDNGAIVEGSSGGHAWTPSDLHLDSERGGVEILKRVSALGARTVLLNGSSALAASFLDAEIVEKIVCYVPFRSPSSIPQATERVEIIPNGYRMRAVTRLDDWVRIEAHKE